MSAPALPPSPAPRAAVDSLTLRGVAVALAPLVASWLGLDPSQLVSGADGAVQLVGLGMAIWGRLRIGDLGWHWPWQ